MTARVRTRWVVAVTLALVAASYLVCALAATYPVVLTFGSRLPGELTDPLDHLWLMRWSRACLLEGRSFLFCPDLNAPMGVPLGYFPTLHVQSCAYILLRLVTDNDIACYNLIWLAGLVTTGLGSFGLAWWTIRKVGPAWLAGLAMMLSGPMLMHAHGHLETMQMGAVPPFLIGWIRFVDRPGLGRLLVAVGLYLLVVACAPYFAVLAVFPAAWYVAWSVLASRGARLIWLRGRVGWLAGFAALALPGLGILFASQVWAVGHGHSMARSRGQFDQFGAPGWSSFVPSPLHAMGKATSFDLFAATGYSRRMIECSSYLGLISLAALVYAALRSVRFPRAGYWWSALALMVVLSWGSTLDLGWMKVRMPAGWIYGVFPPFHLIRVPARFNLFAAACATVPVAAGLADLLGRIGRPTARRLATLTSGGLILADLAMVPFETSAVPPIPLIYRELKPIDRNGAILDAPMFDSGQGQVFSSLWSYWQSDHGARTSAGYPGVPNVPFDSEIVAASPFWGTRLLDPAYLATSSPTRFGPVDGVDPLDYARLFVDVHGYDHVVIHQGISTDHRYDAGNGRLKVLLAEALVFEDADVAVFARTRLRAPRRPTLVCREGVRPMLAKASPETFGVLKEARIAVFNPNLDRSIILELAGASAFAHQRVIRLLDGVRELARWESEPQVRRNLKTTPFRMGGGIRELKLVLDGDDRPTRYVDRLDEARTPYGLRIEAVRVGWLDVDR